MTARSPLILSMLALALGGAAGAEPRQSARRAVYCGGDTDVATVRRYFADLDYALARHRPNAYFNRFVANGFWTRSARGRYLVFRLADVGSVTPRRVAREDWRQIATHGARSLQGAGYRGCFLDSGKAWFEASGDEGFRLKGIAHDLRWKISSDGDAMPKGRLD